MRQSLIFASALSVLAAGVAVAGPPAGVASRGAASVSTMAPPMASTPNARPTNAMTGAATVRGPAQTGQPNQSCGSATAPNTPGASASAPGSAFNPDGKAGSVYAGQQPQNSGNTASVSQYDAACAHAK